MSDPILQAAGLSKVYRMGRLDIPVLHELDLSIESGSFTLIVGHSGCGKSTLLHLLGLLDRPTGGRVMYGGQDAFARSGRWREGVRNHRLGFVFQFYHLVSELSVLGNVMLPEMIRHGPIAWLTARGDCRRRARQMLETVGLQDRMHFKPSRLSGGERQRAAIARALVHNPEIVFADEPTGNLDTRSGWQVFEMLHKLSTEQGKTVVMVSHDSRFIPEAQEVLYLEDGRIVDAETAARLALQHERSK